MNDAAVTKELLDQPSAASEESTPGTAKAGGPPAPMVLFQPPEPVVAPPRTQRGHESDDDGVAPDRQERSTRQSRQGSPDQDSANTDADSDGDEEQPSGRRRRRRGGRRRSRNRDGGENTDTGSEAGETKTSSSKSSGEKEQKSARPEAGDQSESGSAESTSDEASTSSSRRRRVRNRRSRRAEDEIATVSGSTRLEAKRQRRRQGRAAGRRRAPIISESEFLARREAVERMMVIRQREELTQIAVLEDDVLVEHYVARDTQTSIIGNIYLGRVQNVLPSMEAAFIDIGHGRNAVLYAGEVNWAALGHKSGQPRKIESVLSSGQSVLVQVTKDPIDHKGARLTGQISLPGRYLVYVPDGTTSGISRKLPDTERQRLKELLKKIVPSEAGVIVRTAAEGASEQELTRDVERLTAQWKEVEATSKRGKGPRLLYREPDLTLKVVRDLFTEDFRKLIVQGDAAWELVDGYVSQVAEDLRERLEQFEVDPDHPDRDVFTAFRVDEQIAKGLSRKVYLPSGGSLVIDRTEAMTVIDVNTGKFTGSGGNLEETVTKNNLEAAEETVRQLRLRDIGGIIVIDFIDMVLEANRDLVLRRLVECLGRDRTRHQVSEVTSLGLVQMTRKRIGTGLVDAFSAECDHCKGRGLIVHDDPVAAGFALRPEVSKRSSGAKSRSRRDNGGRKRKEPQRSQRSHSAKERSESGNEHNEPTADAVAAIHKTAAQQPSLTQEEEAAASAETAKQTAPVKSEAGARKATESTPSKRSTAAKRTQAKAESTDDQTAKPVEVATSDSAPASTSAQSKTAGVVVTTRRARSQGRPAGPPAQTQPAASVEIVAPTLAGTAPTQAAITVTETTRHGRAHRPQPAADTTVGSGQESSQPQEEPKA